MIGSGIAAGVRYRRKSAPFARRWRRQWLSDGNYFFLPAVVVISLPVEPVNQNHSQARRAETRSGFGTGFRPLNGQSCWFEHAAENERMPRFPAFFCGFQGVRRRPINPLLAFPQTKPASSSDYDSRTTARCKEGYGG